MSGSDINCEEISGKLKQILNSSGGGQVDPDAIHGVMGRLNGADYLKLSEFSYDKYFETKDESYKQIFGIAVTYARVTPGIQKQEWENLSKSMETITKKRGFEWSNLSKAIEGVAKGASSMKTMIFTIINRSLMNDAIQNLKVGLGAARPSPVVPGGGGPKRRVGS